jgi:hypothetical protein
MNKRTFGVLGAGLVALVGGCQGQGGSINGNAAPELAAMLLKGASGFQKDPARAAAMNNTADAYIGLKAASGYNNGQTVIVQGYDPQNPTQPTEVQARPTTPMRFAFACKETRDVNGNGLIDYPEDYEGLGSEFFGGEPIRFYVAAGREGPYRLSCLVWKGDQVVGTAPERQVTVEEARERFQFVESIPAESYFPSGKDYRMDIFVNDGLVAQVPLTITNIKVNLRPKSR